MKTIFCLTILGSVFTLILMAGKSVLLKRYGGRWYCALWILVLLAFCVPYKVDVASFLPKAEQTVQVTEQQPLLSPQETDTIPMETESPEAVGKEKSISAETLLRTVYFGGLAAVGMYYGMVYVLFCRRQKKAARKVKESDSLERFNSVKYEMGIRREIPLLESPSVASPMLMGIFRPRVLLPVDMFHEKALAMIFRHELTHYKRKDLLLKGAALAVHLLHWFNPLSYAALKNINEACEYACDEAVVGKMSSEKRREYGEMLLYRIGRGKCRMFFAGFSAGEGQKKVLKRRLGAIMNGNGKKWSGLGIAAVLGLGLVIGGSVFPLQSIYGKEEAKAEKTTQKLIRESKEFSKEEAEDLTVKTIENLFDPQEELQAEATWNENSDIQPDGWFVRAWSDTWDYAAWISVDGIMTKVVCGSREFPMEAVPKEKEKELQDEKWLRKAEAVMTQNYAETRAVTGETGKITELKFFEDGKEKRTADVQVSLEDGKFYVVSFYPNGMLKAVDYFYETE